MNVRTDTSGSIMPRVAAIYVVALLIILPSEAMADWIVRPLFGAAVSPSHGFIDLEQTSGDTKLVFGGAAGWRPRTIGFEFELNVLPGFFGGPDDLVVSGRVMTLMGNVTWQLPTPSASPRLRAYVAGGAGVVRVSLQDALDAFSSNTSLAAGNVGGGVLVRFGPRLDANIDVRYFKTRFGDFDPAGFGQQFVAFTRVAGGVMLRF